MDNKDLVWDLHRFEKQQRAQEFVLSIENQLCVYSSSVQQLYTNYDIFFPKEDSRKLVILPNPYAHFDTFIGIEESAVSPTGLFLVPTTPEDTGGKVDLMIPLKSQKAKFRRVPIEVGLKMINQKRPMDKPFLPVVMKGDLRELNKDTPCLHLRSLVLNKLPMMSELELSDIRSVIQERMAELAAKR